MNFSSDIFEVLDLQDDVQMRYTGGTVLHLFLGERIDNPEMVKRLVKRICSRYRLPYFTITPTFSVCPECGYIDGENQTCPKCGKNCEIYSRVVGYLRPVNQWNEGKKAEFAQRTSFVLNEDPAQPCTAAAA